LGLSAFSCAEMAEPNRFNRFRCSCQFGMLSHVMGPGNMYYMGIPPREKALLGFSGRLKSIV